MTERVYLHVGAPKSGTTYLQRILEANRGPLADAGVLIVGETHLDRIHAAMVVREDPRLDSLPERASTAWDRLVDQVRGWRGPVAILSYELFAGASAEQAARVLRDLDGIEVHVVITARDLGRAVPSAWQERLKFALTTPLEKWRPRPESAGVRAEWGWRTMDPAGVAARWGAELPPERVHVVTVPTTPGDEHELWRRFAAACAIDPPGLRLDVERVNESLGLPAAELLRRVNSAIREPITGNREQALWLRDTLAHGILAKLGREPIGLTDKQYADATSRADAAVGAIAEAGYAVHGDLEDLRATRPDARTPGDATDAELLEVAVETIVRLLVLVRERTHERDAARRTIARDPDEPRVVALGKGVVRRITAPRVEGRAEDLRARIAELEAEVTRSRELQLRVAELSDVVTELLLPPRSTDGRVTAKALNTYRGQSL
ncbi:DUF6752 domain-containing protein [Nocardioides deserti]|uniref:DUF6752 domain-containing protein n=1 Tax=Nocardioides deserti TaxID=1588644 RepID=A0ABR6U9D6_9ACTN|nr:DUF6752 domain-containing protein [Nocardioides deserti]MBC2960895.1 hypothetical protein [Nocardioides deserti]GGO77704.1 hypothetical protein GCM10012276_33430 [Nocardioides deserti]